MSLILWFDEPDSDAKARVGGKGVNLGLCAQAGFPVPSGFTVTTDAYDAFVRETRLGEVIARSLDGANYEDAADLETRTAEIRAKIVAAELPDALATEIFAAYAELGFDTFVAVRSSGTAEDLAEASFAGLHDTFLNVLGGSAIVDAVRECWTSLWTARAVTYRHQSGLNDIAAIRMAVVVQTMIEPEISGVMFTANPITTATDELVVNASWGLGELVVQGSVTPDEYVVKAVRPLAVGFDDRYRPADSAGALQVKARTVGTKEQRMMRDPDTGHGNVMTEVPPAERSALTLSDDQVLELAELGRRVQSFYEDMPQDIEWAFANGAFYLLQSRPITGVAFDWAADMESFQWAADDDTALWSSVYADVVTGAKSPLYYQWLTDTDSSGFYAIGNLLGIPELMGPSYFTNGGADVNRPARHQIHKYYRCEVYHNTEFERILLEKTFVPALRSSEISPWISLEQAQQVHATRFSYAAFVRSFAQLKLAAPEVGLFKVLDLVQEFIDTGVEHSDPAVLGDISALSDRDLKRAIGDQWYVCAKYTPYGLINFVVYYRQMMSLLARMISDWYDGDNENAYAELCQGVDTRSKTLEENIRLYDLAGRIRASQKLSALFAAHRGADFFTALETSEEGRAFLDHYRDFVHEHGHRGHEDRDFAYPRRYEDPAIDYRSFQLLLARDHPESPHELEQKLTAQREKTFEDVVQNVRRAPITGMLKAEAIKLVYAWVQKFIRIRDDERWAYEKSSLCAKLLCREAGRRCVERGMIEDQEDFILFTKDELYDLLDGRMGVKLARAKVAQRRIDHDRALERTHDYPLYMRDGREVALASTEGHGDGLIGTGWTSGTVTATARVVNRLSEIDRVKQGEILVCQSTDPGWTPVFMLIAGIVIETGGVLAHAVCLAREYGLAAVQLPGARKHIPDGATVTINGSSGEITVLDESTALQIASL